MSHDETQPVSGSRWEQPADQPAQESGQHPVTPAQQPAYLPAPAPRSRSRLALASGAVGIAVVAGAGGFGLGHASADGGREGQGRFGRPAFGQNFQGGPGGQQPLPPFGQNGPRDGEEFPNGQLPDDPRGDLPGEGATEGSSASNT